MSGLSSIWLSKACRLFEPSWSFSLGKKPKIRLLSRSRLSFTSDCGSFFLKLAGWFMEIASYTMMKSRIVIMKTNRLTSKKSVSRHLCWSPGATSCLLAYLVAYVSTQCFGLGISPTLSRTSKHWRHYLRMTRQVACSPNQTHWQELGLVVL